MFSCTGDQIVVETQHFLNLVTSAFNMNFTQKPIRISDREFPKITGEDSVIESMII